jgi:dipeptidase D
MSPSTASSDVQSLEPKSVWRFFAGIAAVPRPSKQEGRIRTHVKELLEDAGLPVREDKAGNLVASVPATSGCESAPITVLQSHLDMVCEKNRDVKHDFDTEGIKLLIDTDPADGRAIVRADGTTLGADNGIGAAMALAVATSKEVKHGPLELLFTMDEEAGMGGAKGLTPDSFKGRRLLNLDTEEDDALYIGCAGGSDATLVWTLEPQPLDDKSEVSEIVVRGLRGGHSGSEIHENRGNANKLLAWTLNRAEIEGLRLASFDGGSKRNAIPREAHAVVAGPPGSRNELAAAATAVAEASQRQNNEPQAKVEVRAASAKSALSSSDSRRVMLAIDALPHGVLGMSTAVPGLVQTSNNVATVNATPSGSQVEVAIGNLARSSSADWLQSALDQITAVGRLAGASVDYGNQYPGWEPDPESKLLSTAKRVYEREFGDKPRVEAIHAGLECGIIREQVGKMDMISLGPLILGAHSPDERVYIESVGKSWKYLCAILDELGAG